MSTSIVCLIAGVALFALDRGARRLSDPARGRLRLMLGGVSFVEIAGMFLIGYGLGGLVAGPAEAAGGPGGPPGRFGGRGLGPLSRADLPTVSGAALAFVTFLVRLDLPNKLGSSGSPHASIDRFVGADAIAADPIPAGGHGQITYHNPAGDIVGVMATADVDIPRGARVRVIGARGLSPVVTVIEP